MTTTTTAAAIVPANLDVSVFKSRNGWRAETAIRLPGIAESDSLPGDEPGKAYLTLSTSKGSRGLSTFASVSFKSGMWTRTAIFKDFAGTVAIDATARATEKAVGTFHRTALERLESILSAVATHYGMSVAQMLREPVEAVAA